MAISKEELTQLLRLIEREGGIRGFMESLEQALGEKTVEDFVLRGASAIGLGVKSWPELKAILASRPEVTVQDIVRAIKAAVAAQDETKLAGAMLAATALVVERAGA